MNKNVLVLDKFWEGEFPYSVWAIGAAAGALSTGPYFSQDNTHNEMLQVYNKNNNKVFLELNSLLYHHWIEMLQVSTNKNSTGLKSLFLFFFIKLDNG